jgi:hypothetical protein
MRSQHMNGYAVRAKPPNAAAFMEAQRIAAENAACITSAAYHYIIALNRTWMDLWSTRFTDFMNLPKPFAEVPIDYLGKSFNDYQEGLDQLENLVEHAQEEAEDTKEEAETEAEQEILRSRAAERRQTRSRNGAPASVHPNQRGSVRRQEGVKAEAKHEVSPSRDAEKRSTQPGNGARGGVPRNQRGSVRHKDANRPAQA